MSARNTVGQPYRSTVLAGAPVGQGGLPWLGGRVPAGGVLYSPAVEANLEAWYRADDVVTSGSSITTYTDKSPNGHDLAQATGTAQPTLATAYGQDTASFDGGDWMRIVLGHTHAQPITWVFVGEATSFAASRVLLDGDDTTNRQQIRFEVTTGNITVMTGATSFNTTLAPSAATVFALCVEMNGASTKVWLDDFRDGSEQTGNAGTAATDAFTLGANTAGSPSFVGNVSEGFCLSESTSAATRANIGNYLTARYSGLTVTV